MKQTLRKGDGIPFTQVRNDLLNDPSLSLKAKGLYAYLYSKPDGYDFAARRIADENRDGREAVMGALKELEDAGYMIRERQKTGRVDYILYANPKSGNPTLADEADPKSGNPTVAKSHCGKTRPLNNKDVEVTKNSNKHAAVPAAGEPEEAGHQGIVAVMEAFQKSGLNPHIQYGNKTQRSAAAELVRSHGVEKVVRYVEFAARVVRIPYAPTITTPVQLRDKLGALAAFAERSRDHRPKVAVID